MAAEPDEAALPEVAVELLATAAVELLAAAAGAPPATAASISAGVASLTNRFWEKMQPTASSAVSQLFPAPVLSLS